MYVCNCLYYNIVIVCIIIYTCAWCLNRSGKQKCILVAVQCCAAGWSSFAAIFHGSAFFHETPPAMSQVQGLVVLDTRTLLDREVVQIHTDTS